MADDSLTLRNLPEGCEQLVSDLSKVDSSLIPIFRGRAALSLWVRAVDNVYRGDHLFARAMKKENCTLLRDAHPSALSFLAVTIVGCPEEKRQSLLMEIFSERTRSADEAKEEILAKELKVHFGEAKKLHTLKHGNSHHFYFAIDFAEVRRVPAYRLGTRSGNGYLVVATPAVIVAEALASMVNKYGELRRPQSRLLLCTTIIVVEKLYAFARHNFPNAAERGPFDDDNIIYGFHRVGPFSNRRTPLIWREVVNDPRLGWFNQEEVKWLKAFRHANNFFCDPLVKHRGPRDDGAGPVNNPFSIPQSEEEARPLEIWPHMPNPWVPQTREPPPPRPRQNRRRSTAGASHSPFAILSTLR
ncbi:hypothetical protein JCM5350_004069 [Sporobolomyces pararoseus]